ADSSQQDHNNQCHQYENITCIPVITEGVDSATIRATNCIMSNCVTTVPALLFAYHDSSLATPYP
ncbi:hypothetical protein, partial [Escherichia coli]|uniref:hypothetical protein n=1 Tax=Escherichia coli TaxID=562 RepID=UPI000B0A6503